MSYKAISSNDIFFNVGRETIQKLMELWRNQVWGLPCPYGREKCSMAAHFGSSNFRDDTAPLFFWDKSNKGLPVYALPTFFRGTELQKHDCDTLPQDFSVAAGLDGKCNIVLTPKRYAFDRKAEPILLHDSEGLLDILEHAQGLNLVSMEFCLGKIQEEAEDLNQDFDKYLNGLRDQWVDVHGQMQGLFQQMPGSFAAAAAAAASTAAPTIRQVGRGAVRVLSAKAGDVFIKPDGTLCIADSEGRLSPVSGSGPVTQAKSKNETRRQKAKREKKERQEAEQAQEEVNRLSRRKLDEFNKQLNGDLDAALGGITLHTTQGDPLEQARRLDMYRPQGGWFRS